MLNRDSAWQRRIYSVSTNVVDNIFCFTLQWRQNEHGGVSNHWRVHCLLNCWFRRRSKKASKLCVTGLCTGNSPVTGKFPTQRPVTRKMFPFDDVIMIIWYDWTLDRGYHLANWVFPTGQFSHCTGWPWLLNILSCLDRWWHCSHHKNLI